jgi:cytochrome P450
MTIKAATSYLGATDNRNLTGIPGTYGYPIIGHTFDFINDPLALMLRQHRKHGEVFRLSLAFQRMVGTVGPESVKLLSLDTENIFSSRMGWEALSGEYFSGSLMLMDFDEHLLQRRMMQSAFKSASLRGYIDTVNTITRETMLT